MSTETKNMLDRQVAGHARAEAEYIARVRAMSVVERARLLEAACRAAALAMHDRAAAGATHQIGSLAAVHLGVPEKARPCQKPIHPLTLRPWRRNCNRGVRSTPWAAQSPWDSGVSPRHALKQVPRAERDQGTARNPENFGVNLAHTDRHPVRLDSRDLRHEEREQHDAQFLS